MISSFSSRSVTRVIRAQAVRSGLTVSLAGAISNLSVLVTTTIFAGMSVENAELRSLMVPIVFLCGAISLMFSIPTQIMAAHGSKWPSGNSLRRSLLYALLAATILWLFSLMVFAMALWVVPLPESASRSHLSSVFLLASLPLAYIPLSICDACDAYLRGKGHTGLAGLSVLIRGLLILGIFLSLVALMGADAGEWLVQAYTFSGVVCALMLFILVKRVAMSDDDASEGLPRFTALLRGVGLPVFASYVLLSTVVSIQLIVVGTSAGLTAPPVFGGVLMIQGLCVVAATGVASGACAIFLRSVVRGEVSTADTFRVLRQFSWVMISFVGVGAGVLAALPLQVVAILLPGLDPNDADARTVAILLLVSAGLVGVNVFFLTSLEQFSYAKLGLVLNLAYLALHR